MMANPTAKSSNAQGFTVLDIARDYVAAGISVIPLWLGGSKAPAIKTWNEYRERFASDDELQRWFGQPVRGIAALTGIQSGGFEGIDFDDKADEIFPAWREQLTPEIRGRLCVIETAGGGYHVWYRCSEIGPCTKLAMPKPIDGEKLKPFIETRGEGGYVVAVGSPLRVHDSGNPYVQVAGVPLPTLPTFTPEQRRLMFQVARTFDLRSRGDVVREYVNRLTRGQSEPPDTSTPWGDFDVNGPAWIDILGPHGWTSSRGETWTRPGKKFGTSAKVVTASNGCEVLTVFSSSAGPLAPTASPYRSIGKFQSYALLNHNGNRSDAAKAVRSLGYGKQQ